ncbi:AraC family transcriptional regulator ligand-binding domain-containing protein [Alkanindiges sp. WGS2144]|uniref:AraC family transcriptional regulator n=1 Tax=Alkanindiges sp. WGS2144 TaxID=3366808 RepID=UPI003751D54A
MTLTNARPDNGIPGVYGLLLLEVVSRFGVSEQTLFSPFDLNSEKLADPNFRISLPLANDLLKHAMELTGEDSLGYHLGTQMRISIHGFIGYAIMSASNVTEALMLASRFIHIRVPFLTLHVSTMQPKARIQLICDELNMEPLRQEVLIALTVGILTMGKALTGQELFAEIECDFPEPKNFEKYEKLITANIKFNQSHLVAYFDKSYLSLPLTNADPIASQIAINQCEAELSALGERKRVAMKVRDLLKQSTERYPTIETIADKLHMSDRTLKRQLAAEGTSYSNVVDEVRYRYAISLLSRSDYSLEQISDELGYSDVGNFTRAFKRWTGRTPGNWRKDPYL